MKNFCLGLIALISISACSEITYTDQRLVAKLMHNGKTYDIYEAIKVDKSGLFVNGTAQQTVDAVYRLFPEGADPQLDGSTTGVLFGTVREIKTCKGKLDACRKEFLAELDDFAKRVGTPVAEERMGGY